MYVKRVVLESLRGFERIDFRFDRKDGKYHGWWVITGANASGKTSLLKAIAMALIGPDAIRSLQPSFQGWIRQGDAKAVVAIEITGTGKDRFSQGRPYEQPFWSELNLLRIDGPEIRLTVGNEYKGKGRGPTHGPWADNPSGWFCSGYGPFRRLYGASPEAQRVMSAPGRIARFATMFKEDATLGECELWLRELHHKKLEKHTKEEQVLEDVLELLNEDFLQNGLRVDRVDSAGLWLNQPNGAVLPLADMSEGYRAALAMLVDLLRHLVHVHGPDGLVKRVEGKLFVPHSGVVLIDEVDAHLHPEWQRQIGFWFKSKFPFIQFIVTTHSAMICQAADEDGLFYLPPPGADESAEQIKGLDYLHIISGKADEILRGPAFRLLNTRSERMVAVRERYARIQAKSRSATLTKSESLELKQLSLFVDSNGEATYE
jgi:AAA domain, putative AbiEii toxin, Type IV TA system/AAA domain